MRPDSPDPWGGKQVQSWKQAGLGTEVKIEAPDLPLIPLPDGAPPASSVPRFLEPPFPSLAFLLAGP